MKYRPLTCQICSKRIPTTYCHGCFFSIKNATYNSFSVVNESGHQVIDGSVRDDNMNYSCICKPCYTKLLDFIETLKEQKHGKT